MPSAPADVEAAKEFVSERPEPREAIRKSFVAGLAVLLPLVITLLVVSLVLGFIVNTLDPLVVALQETPFFGPGSDSLIVVLSMLVFVGLVVTIGAISEYSSASGRISRQFDEFMESIPGVGSVYTSFNEMSELLLDSDTDSFQDVKLVEYPGEDSYTIAFKTAETPEVIADATENDDMISLFMPMAPNPVMGGFVIHVSRERVVDVDLTVEQGIRSIVTSGVAIGEANTRGLTEAQMRELSHAQPAGAEDAGSDSRGTRRSSTTDDSRDGEGSRVEDRTASDATDSDRR